jgi:hypothetical protein
MSFLREGLEVFFHCLGRDCPFGFLDGRTGVNDGGVGLAPRTEEPFPGTHWELIVSPIGGETGGTPGPGPGGHPW